MVKTILVADPDLGFVAYLCFTLTKAGYLAVPATNADGIKPLLRDLNISQIDALVVNLDMAGGVELAKNLSRQHVKIIAIEGARRSEFQAVQIAATLRRADGPAKVIEREWLQSLREVLGEG